MKRLPLKFLVSVQNRNEYNDYDYLEKLDLPTIEWLAQFNQEYLQTNFKHDFCIITDKKTRLELYKDNNHRNTDLYSYMKVRGRLYSIDASLGSFKRPTLKASNKTEDAYNFALDLKTILIRNDQLKKVI